MDFLRTGKYTANLLAEVDPCRGAAAIKSVPADLHALMEQVIANSDEDEEDPMLTATTRQAQLGEINMPPDPVKKHHLKRISAINLFPGQWPPDAIIKHSFIERPREAHWCCLAEWLVTFCVMCM